MKKWDYKYDYPEQRQQYGELTADDKKIIAKKTGYSFLHVHSCINGARRMPQKMQGVADRVLQLRKAMKQINEA